MKFQKVSCNIFREVIFKLNVSSLFKYFDIMNLRDLNAKLKITVGFCGAVTLFKHLKNMTLFPSMLMQRHMINRPAAKQKLYFPHNMHFRHMPRLNDVLKIVIKKVRKWRKAPTFTQILRPNQK